MSVSLILIPTALAIALATGGAGAAGVVALGADEKGAASPGAPAQEVRVQTRMKDPMLLSTALGDLGAVQVEVSGDRLTALVEGLSLEMARGEDGVWAAHIAGTDGRDADRAEAQELIARLDAAYARRVQGEIAERIRSRAGDAGFDLVSETREDDDSVTMVLNVQEFGS